MTEQAFRKFVSLKKVMLRFFTVFVGLFIVSFPFDLYLLSHPGALLVPFTEALVTRAAPLFGVHPPYTAQLLSDTTGLYVFAALLVIMATVASWVWGILWGRNTNYNRLAYWFSAVVSYYLALQLLIYGFNKVFKWQFYTPEPNILFTPVGNMPKDILFWTTMGASYPYTVFLGTLEVIAAFLLLFNRLRLLGSLLAAGIMLNVVAINFSYDISVKLFSLFLLLLCLLLIAPHSNRLIHFLLQNKNIPATPFYKPYSTHRQYRIYVVVKALVISVLLIDVLAVYFSTGNFNGDTARRPTLHGAYNVTAFVKNGDTLPQLPADTVVWKRVFVHSQGYFIRQTMNEDLLDYELEYDTAHHQLYIKNYYTGYSTVLSYSHPNGGTLQLQGVVEGDTLEVFLQKIATDSLPLLQNEFHWTIDSYK